MGFRSEFKAGLSDGWRSVQQDYRNLGRSIVADIGTPAAGQSNFIDNRRYNYISTMGQLGSVSGETWALNQGNAQQVYFENALTRGQVDRATQAGYYQNPNYGYDYPSQGNYRQDNHRQYNDNGRSYQDNGRSNQHYRSEAQPRSMQPNETYDYVIPVGNKQYTIRNDEPLSQQQQKEIGDALRYMDTKHVSPSKRTDELGALQHAFTNGLSPDALIAEGRGRDKPLTQFVKDSMMGEREDVALGLIQQERQKEQYEREQAARARESSSNERGGDNGFAVSQADSKLGAMLNNGSLSAADRIAQIRNYVEGINDPRAAREFHRELAANPDYLNQYGELLQQAGTTGEAKEKDVKKLAEAQAKIAALDPEGAQAAITSGASTREYAAARAAYANRPSTDDLAKLTIDDEDLQKRLQAAIGKQREWDNMAKAGGVAGIIMTLFRPLLEAFSPDSNPMAILAEAKERNIDINGPEAVLAKVEGRAANAEALAADAKSAEQGTSPGTTGAAPGVSEEQLLADVKLNPNMAGQAAQVAADAKQAAANHPGGVAGALMDAANHNNGEERDTAPSAAQPLVPNSPMMPTAAAGVPDFSNLLSGFAPPAGIAATGQDVCNGNSGSFAAGATNLTVARQAECGRIS